MLLSNLPMAAFAAETSDPEIADTVSGSAQTDPAQADPAQTDPVQADPAQTDPVQTDPVQTEPAQTDPVQTDPVQTDPAQTDPVQTDPAQTDPVQTDPVQTDPVQTEPAQTEPAQTEPVEEETVKVVFVCEPADAMVSVYQLADGEKAFAEADEQNVYTLAPGSYYYDAALEGYVTLEKQELTVESTEETIEIPVSLKAAALDEADFLLKPAEDKKIADWCWVDLGGLLSEGTLTVSVVDAENPTSFDGIVSMLPTAIIAGENTVEIASWSCPEFVEGENGWPVEGTYLFTAQLPEGWVLDETAQALEVTVKLEENTDARMTSGVSIDGATFPDANFRGYVLSNFDTDHDYYLSDQELQAVTSICYNDDRAVLSNIIGVELFPNLESLYIIAFKVENLDLSQASSLVNLRISAGVSHLTLGNLEKLETLKLESVHQDTLDISEASNLKMLEIDEASISSLDVSNAANLVLLNLQKCYNLASLDLSRNTELENLTLNGAYGIERLNLKNNKKLEDLELIGNHSMRSLDVSENTQLVTMTCENVGFYNVDLSHNPNLQSFKCTLMVSYLITSPDEPVYVWYLDDSTPVLSHFYDVQGGTLDNNGALRPDVPGGTATMKYQCAGSFYSELTIGFDNSYSWHQDSNGWQYANDDGEFIPGLLVVDGQTYYFDEETGYMQTGWHEIETPWDEVKTHWYYFHPDGSMAHDEVVDGCYLNQSGWWIPNAQEPEWILENGKWKYRKSDGTFAQDGMEFIVDSMYAFDENGYMVIGWESYFYEGKDHSYYFGSDGRMVFGWLQLDGYYYYLSRPLYGLMVTGWNEIDGQTYYMDEAGRMQTGWLWIDGQCYYFNASGVLVRNQWIDGSYVGADGAWAQPQWVQDSYGWYYRQADGSCIYNSFAYIGGNTFYFNEYGYMVTGLQLIAGDYYYFNESGHMVTGWLWLDGSCYYFTSSGAMATNQWIDGSYVGADGAWQVIA